MSYDGQEPRVELPTGGDLARRETGGLRAAWMQGGPLRWLGPGLAVATALPLLWAALRLDPLWAVGGLPAGLLLIGGGVSLLLWPGDMRAAQFLSLAAPVALVSSLLLLPQHGAAALAVALGAIGAFVLAGLEGVRRAPLDPAVPPPRLTPALGLQLGIDELVLATMHLTVPVPLARDHWSRIRAEIDEAASLFAERGWLDEPRRYHVEPPPLTRPDIRPRRALGEEFEHLHFESEYEPRPDEPGRTRWLGYAPTRRAHAWLVRQASVDRPWLICIHGYQMGHPLMDLGLFPPRLLARRLGFNLLYPVLPLHGPRSIGRRSGDGYLGGNYLDMVHAEAQAMWDIRRLIGWIRSQTDAPISVYGISLGGYNAALLSCLSADLREVIVGIPATDFHALMLHHGTPHVVPHVLGDCRFHGAARRALAPVSPLALDPLVPPHRRHLFAGTADRLVPAEQPRRLAEHWGMSDRVIWFHGGHCTFFLDGDVRRLVGGALRAAAAA